MNVQPQISVLTLMPLLAGVGRMQLDLAQFDFDEADAAPALISSGKAKGKVVIDVIEQSNRQAE